MNNLFRLYKTAPLKASTQLTVDAQMWMSQYFNNDVRHWCISKQYLIIYIFNDKQIKFGCESVAQGTKLLDS